MENIIQKNLSWKIQEIQSFYHISIGIMSEVLLIQSQICNETHFFVIYVDRKNKISMFQTTRAHVINERTHMRTSHLSIIEKFMISSYQFLALNTCLPWILSCRETMNSVTCIFHQTLHQLYHRSNPFTENQKYLQNVTKDKYSSQLVLIIVHTPSPQVCRM